eukprot:gene6535-13229_t
MPRKRKATEVPDDEANITESEIKESSGTDPALFSVCIEHCKGVFKNRAEKLSKALAISNIKVSINPTKPRKGSFVVTVDNKVEPVLELLDMPRPFTKLKALDMDEVAKSIIDLQSKKLKK